MSKTVLSLTLLALAATSAGAAEARSPYLARTERGQLAQEIVRRWSVEASRAMETTPDAWARAMAGALGTAPLEKLRRAAHASSLERMVQSLQPSPITVENHGGDVGMYIPLQPCRIADTRLDTSGAVQGMLTKGETRGFLVESPFGFQSQGGSETNCGIDVTIPKYAYVLRITAAKPLESGHLTVYSSGSPPPLAASLNYLKGVNIGSEVHFGAISSIGMMVFTNQPTHLVIDIVGYFHKEIY